MLAVEISKLTKDYYLGFWRRRTHRALDELSLEVEQGQVFGLLGPNGAGKTTTLKILMRLVFPTSGTARILGQDLNDLSLHGRIGYLPENPYFYDHLSPEEFLNYVANLCGLPAAEKGRRVAGLLREVGLEGVRNLPLRKFSKGMTQRLGIAQALVNDPEIVFLDEPMSGLDPLGRLEVRNLILQLKARGKTIFFSTHILPDAETLCDRVGILDHGRLRGCGDLREILGMDISSMELVLEGPSVEALDALAAFCSAPVRTGDRVRFTIASAEDAEKALAVVVQHRSKLISLNPVRASLEEYFIRQVGGPAGTASQDGNPVTAPPREDA
jgi:ABC-2 type transport system ATP-binding protein